MEEVEETIDRAEPATESESIAQASLKSSVGRFLLQCNIERKEREHDEMHHRLAGVERHGVFG
jgi:hypothetical protein